jgi:hypothetical protein
MIFLGLRRQATASLRLPLSFCACASSHLPIRTLNSGESGSGVRICCSCSCSIGFPIWLPNHPSLWSRFLLEKLMVTGLLKQILLLASNTKYHKSPPLIPIPSQMNPIHNVPILQCNSKLLSGFPGPIALKSEAIK